MKDNINGFNKTLNKPSKADSAAMLDPHYALLPMRGGLQYWCQKKMYAVVFFGYMPVSKFCEYDCQKQAAVEEMRQCLGLWMLTGIMKELIQRFTRRILRTPVLCTTQFC